MKSIKKKYSFIPYLTFTNRVLGVTQRQDILEEGPSFKKESSKKINNLNNCVIIIDEVHNVTNNQIYTALMYILKRSYNYRVILLTATPIADNPQEIFEICNLLNVTDTLPIRADLYPDYLTRSNSKNIGILKGTVSKITDLGLESLRNKFLGKVSYLGPNYEKYPKKIDISDPESDDNMKIIKCEMSDYQYSIYSKLIKNTDVGDALYNTASLASTMVYPKNLYGKNGFNEIFYIKGTTSTGNNRYVIKPEYLSVLQKDLLKYSSKLYKLLNNVNNSTGTVFIYSSNVTFGGTVLLKHLLLNNGYHTKTHNSLNDFRGIVVIDDKMLVSQREIYRKIFNSKENVDGKIIKILIGSAIVAEGITLRNVREVHILEPAWNMSRISQVIGRAIRINSHIDLPLEERNVKIYKYVSIYKNADVFFIDLEKYKLSEKKDISNKKIERMLKKCAFNCGLIGSTIQRGVDYSPECDYSLCKYECDIPFDKGGVVDYSTYNTYIPFLAQYDIKYIQSQIILSFKDYPIWNTSELVYTIRKKHENIKNNEILYTIGSMIKNKDIIIDVNGRSGFLIQKGSFVIFNPENISINSSIFSKLFDYSKISSKYTFNGYAKFNNIIPKATVFKKKPIKVPDQPPVEDDIIKYNDALIRDNTIVGSYRMRQTKKSKYGVISDKFKIIDSRRKKGDEKDLRNKISGMNITSFNLEQLKDIISFLGIHNPRMYKSRSDLSKLIEYYLIENDLVLH